MPPMNFWIACNCIDRDRIDPDTVWLSIFCHSDKRMLKIPSFSDEFHKIAFCFSQYSGTVKYKHFILWFYIYNIDCFIRYLMGFIVHLLQVFIHDPSLAVISAIVDFMLVLFGWIMFFCSVFLVKLSLFDILRILEGLRWPI